MEAPKCGQCGVRHWRAQACAGQPKAAIGPSDRPRTGDQQAGEARVLVVHKPAVVVHSPELVVHNGSSQNRHGKYADAEARRAYRREWMRRKRAAP